MAFLLPAVVFITIYTVSQDVRVREAEVWLIPEGYTGPVYIFLGEKCGGEAIFEEKNRRYLFQEERVLFSQHKKNFGMTLQPEAFYYLGKNDERRPISLAVAERPTAPSADTLPVMAFPGQPIKGEAATGRYSLQYAFIGTYRDFTDHIRTSKLPDEAPEALIRRWEAFREDCGAR